MFVYSSKLFEILHDVLQDFYTHHSWTNLTAQSDQGTNHEQLIVQTFKLNKRLDCLHRETPSELRIGTHIPREGTNVKNVRNLQQQVFLCRQVS